MPAPQRNRFDEDLNRGRILIEAARSRPRPLEQPVMNLTEELFGPYTCRRCNSYLHDENVHRSQYGEAPPQ